MFLWHLSVILYHGGVSDARHLQLWARNPPRRFLTPSSAGHPLHPDGHKHLRMVGILIFVSHLLLILFIVFIYLFLILKFILFPYLWFLKLGGFILVGLFIVAGKNNYVWEVVSSSYGCVEEGTKTGACIFLSLGSAVCAWTSAIILTIICLIERYKRREGGLFATARKGNGKKSLHSTKTYGINIVMTPRRLRATCNHQPNIKFITAERHLFLRLFLRWSGTADAILVWIRFKSNTSERHEEQ